MPAGLRTLSYMCHHMCTTKLWGVRLLCHTLVYNRTLACNIPLLSLGTRGDENHLPLLMWRFSSKILNSIIVNGIQTQPSLLSYKCINSRVWHPIWIGILLRITCMRLDQPVKSNSVSNIPIHVMRQSILREWICTFQVPTMQCRCWVSKVYPCQLFSFPLISQAYKELRIKLQRKKEEFWTNQIILTQSTASEKIVCNLGNRFSLNWKQLTRL